MKNPLRSLATRITTLVLIATVVSSLTVSWIASESLDRFLRAHVDHHLPMIAARVADDLDQWYALRTREIEVLSASAALAESHAALETQAARGSGDRSRAKQAVTDLLAGSNYFGRLVVTTPEGRNLFEIGSEQMPALDILRDRVPLTDQARIADLTDESGRHIQIASAPVHDPDGRLVARLFATLDLSSVAGVLANDELGAEAAVLLVDRDLRILDLPTGLAAAYWVGASAENSEPGSPVSHYEDAAGRRVLSTRAPLSRFGWSIVVEEPHDAAFAPIVSSTSRVAMLNLAIVLVVGFCAYRIARSIVKPLRALSGAARRLSQGEREVEIDEKMAYTDDVRVLTQTFNEMSRGLGRNARELEANQRAIEDANRELLAKNEELSNVNLVLEQLAITDGLTKLHNHRYFQEALAGECKRSHRTGEPLCLVLIDIDSFKKWNDRLGHAGGDEILRRMAEVLNQSVRETDLLARYGGEEFALLAIGTDVMGAAAIGEKVRLAVETASLVTDVPSEQDVLTVSVGVAEFRGDRTQLFADADQALYAAKDAGRNRVVIAETNGAI